MKVYRYKNAEIRVSRSELTDRERESRERQIKAALQQIGKSIFEMRVKNNGNSN